MMPEPCKIEVADIRTSASKAAWLPCYIMSCRTRWKSPLFRHQRWREKCVRLQRHRVTSSVKLSPFSVQRSRFRPLFAHIASPLAPISKLSVSTARLSTRSSSKLVIVCSEATSPRLRLAPESTSVFRRRLG
ncbi:hypothetical protein F3P66_13125 [Agrobacterium fabrum]|uniref:Uncharacterized protein n=1 Tax=Agrobacterium fabrum (strain C58 / ATCC 33970) TaxID=176299 RepID=Q8UIL6_AGRFC|nr:hypothetical protein Atu0277 [Agrobacterium fabrum str. C58]QRM60724.1 hypothetical protein F3P66_13125 [Agrobacterium fabrum]TRB32020.1 hypothetical protein EXN51_06280 [Agrobacterium fabrum]